MNQPLSTHLFKDSWHPLASGQPPEYASGWGQDKYGVWVEFTLKGVVQKMRWIPAGEFLMGSPEGESGRDNDEGPLHQVALSRGYWLFDTPVIQALWEAVTGKNPSEFKSPQRPVESVSWHDAQDFIERINDRITGLNLVLPSEAQWEYACRAGTQTATYAGDLEILGERNAPLLDEIAWYGGNSGVDFDLKEGTDSSGWKEKQYPHEWAGTREVALKAPNPLGLYDMLGNVWEWCQDGRRKYRNGNVIDPVGPMEDGVRRVLRGGAWSADARDLRSAYRNADDPGVRYYNVGFRCARVQEGENAPPARGRGPAKDESA